MKIKDGDFVVEVTEAQSVHGGFDLFISHNGGKHGVAVRIGNQQWGFVQRAVTEYINEKHHGGKCPHEATAKPCVDCDAVCLDCGEYLDER